MKQAFVTGSCGFLGTNLIRELLKDNWQVTAFHLPEEDISLLQSPGITPVAGNILDYQSLLDAMPAGSDTVVFHTAGDTTMWSRNAKRQYRINVAGTENVCRAALEKNVGRLVYTSSSSAYGSHRERLRENTVSNAKTCGMNYNLTKYLAEQEVRKALVQGLDAVMVNPCNMMGPYDAKGWSTLIKSAFEKKSMGITSGVGTFAHVKDVARAHISAAEVGRRGENYLIGGEEISFKDMFLQIKRITGSTIRLRIIPSWVLFLAVQVLKIKSFFDGKEPLVTYPRYRRLTGNLRCDDSKARRELGFSTASVEKMIRDSYEWLRQERLVPEAAL
ncbi:MAG: SDR family oxidoreductase [Treponema sp.]|jgi:nucleoside-diphosphate-sugar epimerase|nr:SDR family oxidoreductase [Treponema sp.]